MKLSIFIAALVILGLFGYILLNNSSEDASITPSENGTETMEIETATDVTSSEESVDSETSIETDVELGSGESFTVDSFNFGYSVEEIRVPAGTEVTINLTNSDGFHDWVLDEFNAATEKIQAGETTSVTFVADEAGTYEYYCSVGNHRAQGMVGTLIVE